MDITIHKSDGSAPLSTSVEGDDALLAALSDRYATFTTATGRVMVNKDHIVSIDLPPETPPPTA